MTEYTAWAVTSATPRGRQLAREHLHPVEDQADDQGDKKEQQCDIDKSENNSHELTHISMFIPDTAVSWQWSHLFQHVYNSSTDARQVSLPGIRTESWC